MSKKLTILFTPLDGRGHVNGCIGIGQELRKNGHRVVFAIDYSWRGQFINEGFEEEFHGEPSQVANGGPGEKWAKNVGLYSQVLKSPPIVSLEKFHFYGMKIITNLLKNIQTQLKDIINRVKPDLIIIDNYVCSPAMVNSGIPWVFLASANPLMFIDDERTPPGGLGLSINGPKEEWERMRKERNKIIDDVWEPLNNWVISEGVPPLPKGQLHPFSPYLNIYMIPEELDYLNLRPLPPKWYRFDHFMRQTNDTFDIPNELINKPGKLIYVSMGSMVCGDLVLMRRLVNMLKESPNRIIFSKGPLGDEYELSDNMWGAKNIPQTKAFQIVDLVITHGGNNTIAEAFYYGKPLIVMPIVSDQYDNAQRIKDLGLGVLLNPYTCSNDDLLKSIEKLLNNNELKIRLMEISKRIQSSNSIKRIANLIEQIIHREMPI